MKELKKARLILENGAEFHGWSFGYLQSVAGEVVFNTAMTGYPESLTDPSYKGQILVSTFPLIGNYGVPKPLMEHGLLKYFESDRIHISGLVISDYSFEYSHWNAW
jgi:carbamoyl-phosphate synthase small subunit